MAWGALRLALSLEATNSTSLSKEKVLVTLVFYISFIVIRLSK
jgi:hypothetical protein